MKRVLLATALVVGLGAALLPVMAHATTCTATGFYRDGIDMTAAQIGGNVTSPLYAVGCNIGVYYGALYDTVNPPTDPPTITGYSPAGNVTTGANIFGANYFGVVVNGDDSAVSVNVTGSAIHDIGETPLNGTQHGVAVYYRSLGNRGGTASGTISGDTLTKYQKGGITANGKVTATITNNTVTGQGPVDYIAQNGIQLGYGAKGTVSGNTVTGNAYTGANLASSAGILVVGGEFFGTGLANTVGLTITKNTLTGNDVGVWLFNADSAGNPPSTATNNAVKINKISDGAITNTTGYSPTCGYQAGIADNGKKDLIVNNAISGDGYTPVSGDCAGSPAAFVRAIDLSSKARGLPSNK
jgi:parallel beta-helix repeat protein